MGVSGLSESPLQIDSETFLSFRPGISSEIHIDVYLDVIVFY